MPDLGLSDPVLWFLLGAFLVLAEFLMPGVIIVFFGLAAWVVSFTTAMGWTDTTTSQVLLFSIATVVLLFTLRRIFRRWLIGYTDVHPDDRKKLEEFRGHKARTTTELSPGIPGKIEFKGAQWSALATESIPSNTWVEIVDIDGLTLHVKLISNS